MNEASFQKADFLEEPVDDNAYSSINPTPESARQPELRSGKKLGEAVRRMIGREKHFRAWEREANDKMEAEKISYGKDIDYLYLLAYQSQDESRSIEERQAWADTFTEQSIKIYGAPDPNVIKMIQEGGVERILDEYKGEIDTVRDWLYSEYGDVMSALDLDERTEKLNPPEIASVFRNGLDKLAEKDPNWRDWKVVEYEGSTCGCESSNKEIKVGNKRVPIEPQRMKGLFGHEVLRHAQTAVSASEIGIASALPRYTNAEEGFAKIFEYALSEDPSVIKAATYIDIANALGMVDGKKYTRNEIIEMKIDKLRADGKEVTEKSTAPIYSAVNRIFRGTPGSDNVSGVFTKDISYFAGFVPNLEFIRQRMQAGQTIDQIMTLANSAKFDPNDPEQLNYVKSKIITSRIYPSQTLALPPANPEIDP